MDAVQADALGVSGAAPVGRPRALSSRLSARLMTRGRLRGACASTECGGTTTVPRRVPRATCATTRSPHAQRDQAGVVVVRPVRWRGTGCRRRRSVARCGLLSLVSNWIHRRHPRAPAATPAPRSVACDSGLRRRRRAAPPRPRSAAANRLARTASDRLAAIAADGVVARTGRGARRGAPPCPGSDLAQGLAHGERPTHIDRAPGPQAGVRISCWSLGVVPDVALGQRPPGPLRRRWRGERPRRAPSSPGQRRPHLVVWLSGWKAMRWQPRAHGREQQRRGWR